MRILQALSEFCRELRTHARQNYADAKEDGDKHAKGFADAQMWVYRRVREIMKRQGFCDCDMCVGAEVRHGIGKRLT